MKPHRKFVLTFLTLSLFLLIQTTVLLYVNPKTGEQKTIIQSLFEIKRQISNKLILDSIREEINQELKINPITRKLSPQLINRIIIFANSSNPYQEKNTLISPQRGQLLKLIAESKLSTNTYDSIVILFTM